MELIQQFEYQGFNSQEGMMNGAVARTLEAKRNCHLCGECPCACPDKPKK